MYVLQYFKVLLLFTSDSLTYIQIFIHQKHIGGADDLSHLDEAGVLRSMIVDQLSSIHPLLPFFLRRKTPSNRLQKSRHRSSSPDTHESSSRLFRRQPGLMKTVDQGLSYPLLLLLVLVILAGIGYRIKSRASVAPVAQKQKL
jgi:hypothetical protein